MNTRPTVPPSELVCAVARLDIADPPDVTLADLSIVVTALRNVDEYPPRFAAWFQHALRELHPATYAGVLYRLAEAVDADTKSSEE